MDNDQIYFDDIKREVLPDGRIRYYAEKIVTEIEIEVPRTHSEFLDRLAVSSEHVLKDMYERIALTNPYAELMEGKAPAMGGDLS